MDKCEQAWTNHRQIMEKRTTPFYKNCNCGIFADHLYSALDDSYDSAILVDKMLEGLLNKWSWYSTKKRKYFNQLYVSLRKFLKLFFKSKVLISKHYDNLLRYYFNFYFSNRIFFATFSHIIFTFYSISKYSTSLKFIASINLFPKMYILEIFSRVSLQTFTSYLFCVRYDLRSFSEFKISIPRIQVWRIAFHFFNYKT